MDIEFSLVVPAFNEEGNIIPFLEAVERDMKEYVDYSALEVLIIDDGSQDNTFQRVKDCATWVPFHLKALSFSRNFGKEAAIYAGLESCNGNYICIIDADMQQPPSVAAEMYSILKSSSEYDCVAAFQAERKASYIKNKLSSLFYRFLGKSSQMEVIADASDFRVFSRSVRNALLQMKEYYRFSKGLFAWVGFNTLPFPYTPEERLSGDTSWSVKSLFRYALDGIISFSISPLRIAVYLGVFTSFAAVLYLIFNIIQVFIRGVEVPGYATIVVLILFFGGLQLLTLGVLGEYLGRLYIENKRRPIFIVKTIIDNEKV